MTTTHSMTDEERALVKELQDKIDEKSKDDNEIWIDQDDFTIDEIAVIEEIIDCPIDRLEDPTYKKAKAMKAMAYVVMKRIDPDFKIADAGKLKPRFAKKVVAGDKKETPTESVDS